MPYAGQHGEYLRPVSQAERDNPTLLFTERDRRHGHEVIKTGEVDQPFVDRLLAQVALLQSVQAEYFLIQLGIIDPADGAAEQLDSTSIN